MPDNPPTGTSRRHLILSAAAAVATGTLATTLRGQSAPVVPIAKPKAGLRQTICAWCFPKMTQDQLCQAAVKLGYQGIDLAGPDWFDTLKKYNLTATMVPTHSIPKGLNRKENWPECLGKIRDSIDAAAANGFPNVICFSGNRAGMADDEGMKNCAEGLKQVMAQAEEKKVTICMELLNSRKNHKDYMCDRTPWGVGLVKMVGSERFKLLYDIYHMQIDEGDVIATIKDNHAYFGHYHTAGVPGRNEIDETQELYYPAIMRAIAATGYKGWIGQEFQPLKDPVAALEQAFTTCDV
jgi:hydroxypyruvate isomerase